MSFIETYTGEHFNYRTRRPDRYEGEAVTGRRLYDHYCDHLADHPWDSVHGRGKSVDAPPPAWRFLSGQERRLWDALAKTTRPKRKK